jgi:hypothetical protein
LDAAGASADASCANSPNSVAFVWTTALETKEEDNGIWFTCLDLDRDLDRETASDPFLVLASSGLPDTVRVAATPDGFVVVDASHTRNLPGVGQIWDPSRIDVVDVREAKTVSAPERLCLDLKFAPLLNRPLREIKFWDGRLCAIVVDVNQSVCVDLRTSDVLARVTGQCLRFGDKKLLKTEPGNWRQLSVFEGVVEGAEGAVDGVGMFSRPALLVDL